jgi:hypothetical protein
MAVYVYRLYSIAYRDAGRQATWTPSLVMAHG